MVILTKWFLQCNQRRKTTSLLWVHGLDTKGMNSFPFTIKIWTLGHWLPQSCWEQLQIDFPLSVNQMQQTYLTKQQCKSSQPHVKFFKQNQTAPGTLPDHCTDHHTTCPLTVVLFIFTFSWHISIPYMHFTIWSWVPCVLHLSTLLCTFTQ